MPTPEAVSLDDYRKYHAVTKTDPHLQAAHAIAPWLAIWDDHEVVDDYRGLHAPAGQTTRVIQVATRRCVQGLLRAHAVASSRWARWGANAAIPTRGIRESGSVRPSRHAPVPKRPSVPDSGWPRTPALGFVRCGRSPTVQCWAVPKSPGSPEGFGAWPTKWNFVVQTTQVTPYERLAERRAQILVRSLGCLSGISRKAP